MENAKILLKELKEVAKDVGVLEKSTKLRDLIREVRRCKTAAEERALIAKEAAAMRAEFRETDVAALRPRAVAKLMFMHMLGYPTHFGQMECLKLLSSTSYAEKRMGYLGLTLLLDERAEVLMLVTNSIQNDLKHKNQFVVALALCALGAVASAEMSRDLAPDVERLFRSENAYVRKKAPLAAARVIRRVPELAEGFFAATPPLFRDKHHGVLLAGVTFARQLARVCPEAVPMLRRETPVLVKVLKSLTAAPSGSEHDVGGVTDPFLQVALLRLLRVLGAGDADVSDQMSDILAAVATSTDSSKNAGNAILYEAVQTIMGVESIGSLRVLAVNILGRFLSTRDNNSRYVALNTLAKVVTVDTGAVQRHRATIVECVRDADVSIRRRALELVYGLVNEGNIVALARELVDYLRVADVEFKADLTAKVCGLAARFAPDKRWRIDTLVDVFTKAGQYASQEAVRGAVVLVTNAGPELAAYATRSLYRALSEERSQPALTQTAVWCIGEFGDALCAQPPPPPLEGEEPLVVTENDVIALLDSLLRDPHTPEALKAYCVTALAKLATRLSPAAEPRLRALVATHSASIALELQQRAVEFSALLARPDVRPAALEAMPPPDEAAWSARNAVADPTAALSAMHVSASVSEQQLPEAEAGAIAPEALADLLGGMDASAPPSAAAAAVLADLIGGEEAPAPPSPAPAPAAAPAPAPAPAAAPAAAPPSPAPLAAVLPAGSWGPPGSLGPPFPVFARDGVSVFFQASKPPGQPPSTTLVTATVSNAAAAPLADFLLQAAVPKFMTLAMAPASGAALPPAAGGKAAAVLTQEITVSNSQYGVKPLVMRVKLAFTLGGAPVAEELTVTQFPPGA